MACATLQPVPYFATMQVCLPASAQAAIAQHHPYTTLTVLRRLQCLHPQVRQGAGLALCCVVWLAGMYDPLFQEASYGSCATHNDSHTKNLNFQVKNEN